MRYELRNKSGGVLLIIEAESHFEAKLYGSRHVPGFHRALELPEGDRGLLESFRALHPEWSDAQVRLAATGTAAESYLITVQDGHEVGEFL